MSKKEKNIIIYVASVPFGAAKSVRLYEKREKCKFRIMLLRDSKKRNHEDISGQDIDIVLDVDFSNPSKMADALLPYQDELLAITCRGDSKISKFIKVIPHVPYLRTPTTESLRWATDKYEMRKRFRLYDKTITPVFTKVKSNTKIERKRIAEKVGFPMMIKPTNLAESFLVSICFHEEDLDRTLKNTFLKIQKVYKENNRNEEPNVIAEEYIEGEMFSVDAYVTTRGKVYFCPLVKVVTGRDIGHDDFYGYMRVTPTALKKTTIERAEHAAETGIHALGLRNTTAHVELMKVDDEWKVVEIGPRIGGFRHKLHQLSCDIDHSLNDVLVRLPKKPIIPKKCNGFAVTMQWYPKKEGTITTLKGIKKIQELKSFVDISVNKKVGDRCKFAKNGGKAVFTLTMYNKDRSKLLADIRRVEQLVEIKVR